MANDKKPKDKKSKDKKSEMQVLLIGVGLDDEEGHHRVTRAEDMLLLGGSRETHENMQDMVIRIGESLRKRGKRLQDASVDDIIDLLSEASDC